MVAALAPAAPARAPARAPALAPAAAGAAPAPPASAAAPSRLEAARRSPPVAAAPRDGAALATAAAAAAGLAAAAALAPRRGRRAARGPRARPALTAAKPRWAAPSGGKGGDLATTVTQSISQRERVVEEGGGRCYRVTYPPGIALRGGPTCDPRERTGDELAYGEVFEVKKVVRQAGREYLELLDGRGWAFDWNYIDDERVELVELAAQLYTAAFPSGVSGIVWQSDTTMQCCQVKSFSGGADVAALTEAGLSIGDTLVMLDQDPLIGMPFAKVLERLWATAGRAPGTGEFYKVVTESPYGIGIRATPDVDGPRTGQDLIRGEIFEVDEVVTVEGGPTFLHLANRPGWVFDLSPVSPETPTVVKLSEIEPGCTLTLWRGSTEDLGKTIGLDLGRSGSSSKTCNLTVIEDGQPNQRLKIPWGSNLRKALVDNGFQLYQDMQQVFNCNAQQLCGTCVIDVVEGEGNLPDQPLNEAKCMAGNPQSYRLCCATDVFGDVSVRIRPPKVKYGGGSS